MTNCGIVDPAYMEDKVMLAKEFFEKQALSNRDNGHGRTASVVAQFVDGNVEITLAEMATFMLALSVERFSVDRIEGRMIAELAQANYELAFAITATLNVRALLAR